MVCTGRKDVWWVEIVCILEKEHLKVCIGHQQEYISCYFEFRDVRLTSSVRTMTPSQSIFYHQKYFLASRNINFYIITSLPDHAELNFYLFILHS